MLGMIPTSAFSHFSFNQLHISVGELPRSCSEGWILGTAAPVLVFVTEAKITKRRKKKRIVLFCSIKCYDSAGFCFVVLSVWCYCFQAVQKEDGGWETRIPIAMATKNLYGVSVEYWWILHTSHPCRITAYIILLGISGVQHVEVALRRVWNKCVFTSLTSCVSVCDLSQPLNESCQWWHI